MPRLVVVPLHLVLAHGIQAGAGGGGILGQSRHGRGGDRVAQGGALVVEGLVDDKIVVGVGHAAAVVEVAVEVAGGLGRKAGVDAGVVIDVEKAVEVGVAVVGVFDG